MNPGSILLGTFAVLAGGWDIFTRRIPNWLTISAAVLGLAWNFHRGNLLMSVAGMAAGIAILLPFYLLKGTGAGDVKMLGAVGAIVGLYNLLAIFVYFAIFGGLVAVVVAISVSRFGHVIKNTTYLASLLGRGRWGEAQEMQTAAPRLPYGAVIATGCLLFLWIGSKKI